MLSLSGPRGLLLVVVVVVVVILVEVEGIPRWHRYRRPTTRAPRQVIKSNRTRYGNSNLCKICSTSTYNCSYKEYRYCSTLDSYTSNGTRVWPDKNSTTKAYPNDSGSDRGKRRRKRESEPDNEQQWPHQWYNNYHGDSNATSYNRPFRRKRCQVTVDKMCTERKCVIECCDGTEMETGTNSCKKRRKDDGTLDGCMNGGTLNSRRTHCTCSEGFIGAQCQHRTCSVKCQNGGQCQTNTNRTSGRLGETTYNDDFCVCPSDTTGRFCEKKKCEKECQNNGTCIRRWRWSECVCKSGFSGQKCEKEDKEGDCPPASEIGTCRWYSFRYECSHDVDCKGTKKCCRNTCYDKVCTEPFDTNITCSYNNITHPLGSVFRPDPCRICTCNDSHVGELHGAIECTRTLCPDLPTQCRNVTTPPNECCPICNDDPDHKMCGGNYQYPHFVNCPDDEVVIDVDKGSDSATVNLNLTAVDCRGHNLDILISEERLLAGIGDDNYHLLSATSARDGKGNFAECIFHVRVRDDQPPEFLTCPMDFVENTGGPVSWAHPVARDNVGLKIPPTSDRHPGERLPAGKYLIEYWTEDYEGNIARCSFVVTVESHGDGHSFNPHHDNHHGHDHTHGHDHLHPPSHPHHPSPPQPASHKALSIGLGVTCTLIIVIVIVGIYIFYRRYRRTQDIARGTPSVRMASVNGMGNGITWNGHNMGDLPRYGMSAGDVMAPPMYSRDDMIASGGGAPEAGELPAKGPLPE